MENMLLLFICAFLSSPLASAVGQKTTFKVPKYNPLPTQLKIQSTKLKLNITLGLNGYDYSILNTTVYGLNSTENIDLGPLRAKGYSHPETGSSIVASEEGPCIRLDGLVRRQDGSGPFKIRPVNSNCDTSSLDSGDDSSLEHYIEEIIVPESEAGDIKDYVKKEKSDNEGGPKVKAARAGPGQYEDYHIESRVYTDSTMYNRFLTLNGQDQARALSGLRLYVVAQMNQVDTVYKNIDRNTYQFQVSVWLKELIIITNRFNQLEQDVYRNAIPEGIQSTPQTTYIDSEKMLNNLETFSKAQSWSDYDYLFWITKYNLAAYANGQRMSSSIVGLAPYAENAFGICGNDGRQTIIEDDLNTWSTMAHELGHSLGCQHDGTGTNTCDSRQSFIMTAEGGDGNLNTIANRYRWSQCSINEMRTILRGTNSNGYERVCLYNRPCAHAGLGGVSPTTGFPDVSGFSTADEQCRRLTSNPLCPFVQENNPDNCKQLQCRLSSNQCTLHTPGLLPGSRCGTGNSNWCQNGLCVPKQSTNPSSCSSVNLDTTIKSSCQQRDDSNVVVQFSGLRCPQHFIRFPHHCITRNDVATLCCFSCQRNGWQAQSTNILSLTTTNFCSPNPCRNDGRCNSLPTGFQCSCRLGYSGNICDVYVCSPNPCFRGQCSPLNSGFSCRCDQGWSGERCDQQSDNCPSANVCNNGRCISETNSYRCECNVGWRGNTCNERIDYCLNHGCVNGQCESLVGSYQCRCNSGWTGRLCDQRSTFCTPNICNNGRCISEANGYRCECNVGWRGNTCNERIDYCLNHGCVNGQCESLVGSYQCRCNSGWTGRLCDQRSTFCTPNICNNGQCISEANGFRCSCNAGWQGRFCNQTLDSCSNNRCVNGRCVPLVASYRCECNVGWGGTYCNENRLCQANTCANGGTCAVVNNDQIKCQCLPGYYGAKCESYACAPNPCLNGGTCQPELGGYKCSCLSGWVGSKCDIRETNLCANNPCLNGGTCSLSGDTFTCQCATGFTGRRCENKENFCKDSPCLNNGFCTSLSTTFRCQCQSGFTGTRCETVISNSCNPNPCRNNARCIDLTGGSYRCVCESGWTGQTCNEAINTCAGDPCRNGRCISRASGFECQCFNGWSGTRCDIAINNCIPNPCYYGQCLVQTDLVRYPRGFTCSCSSGWTGDFCSIATVCNPNPCFNGYCNAIDRSPGYICDCFAGWNGTNCNIGLVGVCNPSPCIAGQCVVTPNTLSGYTCNCFSGYTGQLCNLVISNACSPSPCRNNGNCALTGNGYICNCPAGYSGRNCEYRIRNYCTPNPCLHGGQCRLIDGGIDFRCECTAGYSGTYCESSASACQVNPCQNGGTCRAEGNTFTCLCTPQWSGRTCTTVVSNPCTNNPCRNGAQCVVESSGVSCICTTGWYGQVCDRRDYCAANPCLNGGACTNQANTFSCTCITGYTGDRCEIPPAGLCTDGRNPCKQGTCSVNNDGTSVSCRCQAGWQGPVCDQRVLLCPTYASLCKNGAECRESEIPGRIVCICTSGWEGGFCDQRVNQCSNFPCQNNGVCRIDSGTQRPFCQCVGNWRGTYCNETTGNACSTIPCLNNGDCTLISSSPGYRCTCSDQWTGDRCHLRNYCSGVQCNNGQCQNLNTNFQCVCNPGWRGTFCNIAEVTGCNNSPCRNDGTCITQGSSYTCQCTPQWTGRDCTERSSYCSGTKCNNGRCIDLPTTYKCECNRGWFGDLCNKRDLCFPNPCYNGGTCYMGGSTFGCRCLNIFSGSRCEFRVNPCSAGPCKNDGTCRPLVDGTFSCDCRGGYIGLTCEVFAPCESSPCRNDGTCSISGNTYTCRCQPLWAGDDCSVSRCVIVNGGCARGSCVISGNTVRCQCPTGYTGERCNIQIGGVTCNPNPCRNSGTCYIDDVTRETRCSCVDRRWAGPTCSDAVCTILNPCVRGTCIPQVNTDPTCQCPSGYAGSRCETFVGSNACNPNPCRNSGICSVSGSTFSCDCRDRRYTGSTCTLNICDVNNPCIRGTCIGQVNDNPRCQCPSDYTGDRCQTFIGSNVCNPNPCRNSGTCSVSGSTFSCDCRDRRYTGSTCTLNICDVNNPCIRGTCIGQVNDNPRCQCPSDYTGDRCQTFIGSNVCNPNPCRNSGICSVSGSTFSCDCRDRRYTGSTCTLNICDVNNPCIRGTCIGQVNDNPRCQCPSDYTGDRCQTFIGSNVCNPNPCRNSGICSVSGSTFSCDCRDRRYTGSTCTLNICNVNNPCIRGTCIGQVNDNPRCQCPSDYTGDRCQTFIGSNVCNPNPCRNSGTCSVSGSTFSCDCRDRRYTGSTCTLNICDVNNPCIRGTCIGQVNENPRCQCPSDYTGDRCQTFIGSNVCNPNPCRNSGVCSVSGSTFSCDCRDRRYTGTTCTLNICDVNNPCIRGTCIGQVNENPRCQCPSGYTGSRCETFVGSNVCNPNPCRNSGICSVSGSTFSCDCRDRRFGGSTCDRDICQINPCSSGTCVPDRTNGATCITPGCTNNPCRNGGTCLETVFPKEEVPFICECRGAWSGLTCETPAPRTGPCQTNPCRNDGRCIILEDSTSRCHCQAGYYGDTCELPASSTSSCLDAGGRAHCVYLRESDRFKICEAQRNSALERCKFTCNLCGIPSTAAKREKDD
ncbi:DgyrCDS12602 [Dimorphilus gyrociliatus]|uniref:DgyrCDS12602 n=1 Tax=Dimorphilus gyrociliatus TaxID=2664684 RepID=A0A7I8W7Q0_9ANNE|nr:DgyrCDS12602 [Dimorphilus gyrociliatus]